MFFFLWCKQIAERQSEDLQLSIARFTLIYQKSLHELTGRRCNNSLSQFLLFDFLGVVRGESKNSEKINTFSMGEKKKERVKKVCFFVMEFALFSFCSQHSKRIFMYPFILGIREFSRSTMTQDFVSIFGKIPSSTLKKNSLKFLFPLTKFLLCLMNSLPFEKKSAANFDPNRFI